MTTIHVSTLEKKLLTIFAEEISLIPFARYQMYYNYAEIEILQQIPMEKTKYRESKYQK
jgi:hypothetical protein